MKRDIIITFNGVKLKLAKNKNEDKESCARCWFYEHAIECFPEKDKHCIIYNENGDIVKSYIYVKV